MSTPIKTIGWKRHLKNLGVDAENFGRLVDAGATVSSIARYYGRNRITIKKWRQAYLDDKAKFE